MRQSGWPQVAGVLAGAVLAVWFGGASAQQPQFGATVARVRVDVIVTDEDGDFVEDLTVGNFRAFRGWKAPRDLPASSSWTSQASELWTWADSVMDWEWKQTTSRVRTR